MTARHQACLHQKKRLLSKVTPQQFESDSQQMLTGEYTTKLSAFANGQDVARLC